MGLYAAYHVFGTDHLELDHKIKLALLLMKMLIATSIDGRSDWLRHEAL